MKPEITAIRHLNSLRIYIDNILHLELPIDNHDGVQSWLVGTNNPYYCIEFYRKQGEPILLEYEDKDIWVRILDLIDKKL